jgi:hypothetical protein
MMSGFGWSGERIWAQAKRLRLNPHLRLRVYAMLYHLNRGFTLTVMNLDRLDNLGLFRRDTYVHTDT